MVFNFENFRAPYIDKQSIHRHADRFRKRFPQHAGPPVAMHEIIEFELGIEIRPVFNLCALADVDALLFGDSRTILVDLDFYMKDQFQNRLRFSLAHEVGHTVLHRDIYAGLEFATLEDWFEFVEAIPEREWGFLEYQAREFAGRLLVDPQLLSKELEGCVKKALDQGLSTDLLTTDQALEHISSKIAGRFGVSWNVIEKRLRIEDLWPPKT